MSNLTITIDANLLRAARVKAAQQGTSVNEICRLAIAAFAHEQADAEAQAQAFRDHAKSLKLGPSIGHRRPTREQLHDDIFAPSSPPIPVAPSKP